MIALVILEAKTLIHSIFVFFDVKAGLIQVHGHTMKLTLTNSRTNSTEVDRNMVMRATESLGKWRISIHLSNSVIRKDQVEFKVTVTTKRR